MRSWCERAYMHRQAKWVQIKTSAGERKYIVAHRTCSSGPVTHILKKKNMLNVVVAEYLGMLDDKFQNYLKLTNMEQYDWVHDPFDSSAEASINKLSLKM